MKIESIVAAYLEVRAEKEALVAKHKAELETYNDILAETESLLLGMLNEVGVDSMKTSHGTVYTSTIDSVTVKEWDQVLDYIKTNERWDLLTKKIVKTAMEDAEMVPGTELTRIKRVNVRRS